MNSRCLITRPAVRALKHTLDAADGDDGHYEEDGDEAHPAFGNKLCDRAALAATHGLRSLPGTPCEKARAYNQEEHDVSFIAKGLRFNG